MEVRKNSERYMLGIKPNTRKDKYPEDSELFVKFLRKEISYDEMKQARKILDEKRAAEKVIRLEHKVIAEQKKRREEKVKQRFDKLYNV